MFVERQQIATWDPYWNVDIRLHVCEMSKYVLRHFYVIDGIALFLYLTNRHSRNRIVSEIVNINKPIEKKFSFFPNRSYQLV